MSLCIFIYIHLGYRQRWFRLKGNLLFYFKVDEYGGWEVCFNLCLLLIMLFSCVCVSVCVCVCMCVCVCVCVDINITLQYIQCSDFCSPIPHYYNE